MTKEKQDEPQQFSKNLSKSVQSLSKICPKLVFVALSGGALAFLAPSWPILAPSRLTSAEPPEGGCRGEWCDVALWAETWWIFYVEGFLAFFGLLWIMLVSCWPMLAPCWPKIASRSPKMGPRCAKLGQHRPT